MEKSRFLYWQIFTSYLDWSLVPKRLMPFFRFSNSKFLNCFASSSNFANFLKAAISSSVSFPFSQKSHKHGLKHAEKHFLLKFSCRPSFPVIEIPSPVTLPLYFLCFKQYENIYSDTFRKYQYFWSTNQVNTKFEWAHSRVI